MYIIENKEKVNIKDANDFIMSLYNNILQNECNNVQQ